MSVAATSELGRGVTRSVEAYELEDDSLMLLTVLVVFALILLRRSERDSAREWFSSNQMCRRRLLQCPVGWDNILPRSSCDCIVSHMTTTLQASALPDTVLVGLLPWTPGAITALPIYQLESLGRKSMQATMRKMLQHKLPLPRSL